jgi:hypothetical protein
MIITTAYVTAVLVALVPMLIFSSSFAAHAQPQQPTQSKACPEGFELNKRGFCQTEPEPRHMPPVNRPF